MNVDGVAAEAGEEMHRLCARLYPLVRSITGDGVRETLAVLREHLPLQLVEVPSGTPVYDWTVPLEWNVKEAYVQSESGERVIDMRDHSLHVVSYSEPVRRRLTLEELQGHLHSLREYPDRIPYRTSYYKRSWGFSVAHEKRERLVPGSYDVVIDSTLEEGSLTYGELMVPGVLEEEILISTHICHPALANDNLSGIAVATFLAKALLASGRPPTYTFRFLFIPSTIGAITWLASNEAVVPRVAGGFVISGVGDAGPFTYKRSRHENAVIDRLFDRALRRTGEKYVTEPFSPYGYDERQFCSPGINIPMGCLMRTPFGRYSEYHTSADDLTFINARSLAGSLGLCSEVMREFNLVRTFRNLSPKCEPQLGRRGLYAAIGGDNDRSTEQMALLWMLNYSDGCHSTLDISTTSGLALEVLERAADRLVRSELLEQC